MHLKEYLDHRGISQSEFAEMVGLPRQTISRYVLGDRRPSTSIALKIEQKTRGKVSIEDLMDYADKHMKK